ncbi:MAG: DUF3445 domain-containing protein [Acidimicrobiia bacterium]|nr:DUF3445 domain-containing protein [Acidimicrobiia bacterium]
MPTVANLPHEPFLAPLGSAGFRWRLGLRPLDLANWFDDGPDAPGWIAEKEIILADHHETVFAVLDDVDDEANEVAKAVVSHLRFAGASCELRSDVHPLEAASRLVAEDLVLMIEREGRLVFGGGSVCFPNRWDLRSKLGLTLREVHAPVPRLNEQLGEPVERILARLTPERSYWRLGWGIIDVAEGYTPTDGTGPSRPALPSTDTLHVRVERETLRRFPCTGCVLFTIRTYVARLDDVAADGVHRDRLAAAVDLMPGDVREYKDLATFGEELVRSLRSNDGFAPEVDTLWLSFTER